MSNSVNELRARTLPSRVTKKHAISFTVHKAMNLHPSGSKSLRPRCHTDEKQNPLGEGEGRGGSTMHQQ